MKYPQFKKINKPNPILSDLLKLSKEDLAENFLTCYQALQELLKENEELNNLTEISKNTIQNYKQKESLGTFAKKGYSAAISNNTFTCFFCLEKLECDKMLAGILANGNVLLCNLCLKNS